MQTTRHDLPSGGWVDIRDHNYLRGKDRQALMRKITRGVDPQNMASNATSLGLSSLDEIAALVVAAWSLPYAPEPIENGDGTTTERTWTLPSEDSSMLGELLAPDYETILNLSEPARRVLMPSAPTPDQHEDPGSPSGPESA